MTTPDPWLAIQERFRNSVVQIKVTGANYDVKRPYMPPRDSRAAGSGFFIDAPRGVLLTNAHVISDTMSIVCRVQKVGKVDLRTKLVSICPEKDLALVQIYAEDLKLVSDAVGDLKALNMTFGDSLAVRETDECMSIGYPLGAEAIKATTGRISGFYPNVESENDDIEGPEDSPSFLQHAAALNGGNSGGPLVNAQGLVIGINAAGVLFAQSVAYAIPSRTVFGVLPSLLAPASTTAPVLNGTSSLIARKSNGVTIVRTPRVAFDWNESNAALIATLVPDVKTAGITGIYVTKVYPDSCLHELKEGDLLTAIAVELTTPCGMPGTTASRCKEEWLGGSIDNFGDVSLTSEEKTPYKRKLALKEVFDMVPIGNRIVVMFWRNKVAQTITVQYTYPTVSSGKTSLKEQFLHFEPLDYEIVGGLVIAPLTLNYIAMYDDLTPYAKGDKRYERYLVITQILPGTQAAQTKSLTPTMVLDTLTVHTPKTMDVPIKVRTLNDLRIALDDVTPTDTLIFKTFKRQTYAASVKQALMEDVAAMSVIGVPSSHPYVLSPPPSSDVLVLPTQAARAETFGSEGTDS